MFKKKTPRKASFYLFSPKNVVRLFILKEVKHSPDGKMIQGLTFDDGYYVFLAHARALLGN